MYDHQFAVGGVTFGAGCPIEVEKFRPNAASWRTQDKPMPRGDGVRPGRDYRGGSTWGFDAFTNGLRARDALDAIAELGAVWPTEELRAQPRAMTELRYALDGRTRRIYGRPREFDYPLDTRYSQGMIPVTMNFAVMDPLFYDDAENVIEVDLIPETAGGLRSPVRSPVRSVWTGLPADKRAVVGGDKPTWATVEFQGTCLNPWLKVGDLWRVQAMTDLVSDGPDDVITLDSRPSSRSTTRRGFAVPVSRTTRVAEMLLPPGRHVVTFGADGGTLAKARLRWRNAYPTI